MHVEQVDFVSMPTLDVARAVTFHRDAAGGEVLGIEDTGVCHLGFCRDLDGNTIHRRYAPRAAC